MALSAGAIAGIVIGSIVGLILLLAPVFLILARRKRAQRIGQAGPPTDYPLVPRLDFHPSPEEFSVPPIGSAYPVSYHQQQPSPYGGELVNHGSMQVKGVRNIEERDGERRGY
ncbi:hypothetical protein EK21DRAFT_90844 [Setomelanomma holmii]|uniref:Uncharacterized protein n=1 Tax=Setomelanomma holmii TaxID=210430 RepID=A0A9P4H7Y1_9PLEO|nr:hypothetical protein EK21DRAFT_90844 [Setomelanomma holmii]